MPGARRGCGVYVEIMSADHSRALAPKGDQFFSCQAPLWLLPLSLNLSLFLTLLLLSEKFRGVELRGVSTMPGSVRMVRLDKAGKEILLHPSFRPVRASGRQLQPPLVAQNLEGKGKDQACSQ